MKWWKDLKTRRQALLAEYGRIAIATFVGIAITNFTVFWVLVNMGVELPGSSLAGGAGKFGIAYAAYKVFMPARIVLALALTPLVGQVVHRVRPPRPAEPEASPDEVAPVPSQGAPVETH